MKRPAKTVAFDHKAKLLLTNIALSEGESFRREVEKITREKYKAGNQLSIDHVKVVVIRLRGDVEGSRLIDNALRKKQNVKR